MKRIFLFIIFFLALIGIFFFGKAILEQNEQLYAPALVFGQEDESIFLLHRPAEIENTSLIEHYNNPLVKNLSAIRWGNFSETTVYISKNRPLLIFKTNYNWKTKQVEELKNAIKSENSEVLHQGRYLMVKEKGFTLAPTKNPLQPLNEFDKKASANQWDITDEGEWKRTDIYALHQGYYEYISQRTTHQFGKAVEDVDRFASVLPQNIERYIFHERFFAIASDSFIAKSPMNEWLDKGFVEIFFKNNRILVSDYRTKQLPSLLLLEKSDEEDSIVFDQPIKSFIGFQLTENFPANADQRFYCTILEDKTIFSENREVLEEIVLRYNLGETLALNEEKQEQLFGDLPQKVHYRYIDRESKRSITFKKDLRFEVATVPPGESLVMTDDNNWSFNPGFEKIKEMTPISDHLRGGHSLFIHDDKGNYKLITQIGEVIWEGTADSTILSPPKVVDVFENNKKQLLFTTAKKVYLIDLKGNSVGSFPYTSDHPLSSSVSTFKWNGTIRFLVGNQKGELIMLNNTGKELNVIQIDKNPIADTPFALNVSGNLRAWVLDNKNRTYLAYLETPAKREDKGQSSARFFVKTGKSVTGLYSKEGRIYTEDMEKSTKIIAEGKLLSTKNKTIVVQNQNEISLFNFDGALTYPLTLGFNEVGKVIPFVHQKKRFTLVFDYLGNKVYLYDQAGLVVEGFPLEARGDIAMSIDKEIDLLNIFTLLNDNIYCYKQKLEP